VSRFCQIGRLKFDALEKRSERRFKWHGTAGYAAQYLTTFTLVLGVYHVMGRSLDTSFAWCILFAVGCVFASWFCLMRETPIWCRPIPLFCSACRPRILMIISGSTALVFQGLACDRLHTEEINSRCGLLEASISLF
jgi:hypothetical protein